METGKKTILEIGSESRTILEKGEVIYKWKKDLKY